MNKLSRKDIAMMEMLATTTESDDKLAEYIYYHQKAAKAYKAFREAVLSGFEVEKVVKPVEVKRKFKAGDKVRVLDVSYGAATSALDAGDITEVVGYKDEFEEYELLAPEERPVVVVEPEGETGLFEESALELVEEKSPNELRAEIIEKAKEFVKECRNRSMVVRVNSDGYAVDVSFIVNTDKRTVVALMMGVSTGLVRSKGIAKCSPGDVFNEHIGKAIALGRALGKDVSEFENAPQPTEPVIGHKLSNVHCDDIDEITTIKRGCMFVNNTGGYWGKDTLDSGITKIIDDTNAQY